MNRFTNAWRGSLRNKIVIVVAPLLFVCCLCGIFVNSLPSAPRTTTTPGAGVSVGVATTPINTAPPASTSVPANTAVPTSSTTPAPSATQVKTPTPLPPTSTPTPAPTNTPVPTSTRPPATATPVRLLGQGQQASAKFTLASGLTIFRMTHNGASNFAIFLLDSGGNRVELLVNEVGRFTGSRAIGLSQGGTYLLDVSADGAWTVAIEQPPVGSPAPAAPQTFTGTGQQASPKIALKRGLTTFRMSHGGTRNFAIFLYDDEGNRLELLVNTIGAFNGSKAVGIPGDGVYVMDISADGKWTVSVEQ